MQNSPSNSLRIWEQQHHSQYPSSEEEETEIRSELDYRDKFQKNNQLYNLRSQLNAANLALQKIAIQQQQQTLEERNFYHRIEAQKNQIEARQAELEEEVRKNNLIAEAERNAKASFSRHLKELKAQMKQITDALGLQTDISKEAVIAQIQTLLNNSRLQQQNIQVLRNQIDSLQMKLANDVVELKGVFEKRINDISDSYNSKLRQCEQRQRGLVQKYEQQQKSNESLQVRIKQMEKVESQLRQATQRFKEQSKINSVKEEQLVSLKVKQELLEITKEKWQQEKIKHNERMEQFNFKLQLMEKRFEVAEKRRKEEEEKRKQLQVLHQQLKQQLKTNEEYRIQLEETANTLKHRVQINEAYKEKYKASQDSIKQHQENNQQHQQIICQLEMQCRSYEQQINFLQGEKIKHEQIVSDMSKQILDKDKQLAKLNISTTHQAEVIKEYRMEIHKYKIELSDALKEAARKKSIISIGNQSQSDSSNLTERQHWQKISQEIIAHYHSLLESDDGHRRQLQKQLQASNDMGVQLRSQLSYTHKQLAEVRQQNRLVREENDRLLITISVLQANHEKRVIELKDRYKDIQKPTFVSLPRSPKSEKAMNITNCFSITEQFKQNQREKQPFAKRKEPRKVEISGQNCRLIGQAKQQTELSHHTLTNDNQRRVLAHSKSSELARTSELDKAISSYKQSNRNIKSILNL